VLSQIIWVTGIFVEALLLYRGLRARLVTKYLNFYIYILSIFLPDVFFFVAPYLKLHVDPKWDRDFGFVTLFLGFGIVLEIFKHILVAYPGAEKVARIASYAFLVAVMAFLIIYPMFAQSAAEARLLFYRLQRDFLTVQALFLIVIIRVMAYYAIPAGRNLKGMILGYGEVIAVTMCGMALRAYKGYSFDATFNYMQQASYLVGLVIWLIALWSYLPDTVPPPTIMGDGDYDALANRTRAMVNVTGSNLVKVERL
jgi:hypothetical protein